MDATNLDRHLYLTTQLMELGIKPVLALNMWDEANQKRIGIDIEKLKKLLGLRIVATTARTGEGIDALIQEAMEQARNLRDGHEYLRIPLPIEIESGIDRLEQDINSSFSANYPSRWMILKLLEHDVEIERLVCNHDSGHKICKARDRAEAEITSLLGDDPGNIIAEARYGYIAGLLREIVSRSRSDAVEVSGKIDSVLTHRFWAYPIFIVFMWLLF